MAAPQPPPSPIGTVKDVVPRLTEQQVYEERGA